MDKTLKEPFYREIPDDLNYVLTLLFSADYTEYLDASLPKGDEAMRAAVLSGSELDYYDKNYGKHGRGFIYFAKEEFSETLGELMVPGFTDKPWFGQYIPELKGQYDLITGPTTQIRAKEAKAIIDKKFKGMVKTTVTRIKVKPFRQMQEDIREQWRIYAFYRDEQKYKAERKRQNLEEKTQYEVLFKDTPAIVFNKLEVEETTRNGYKARLEANTDIAKYTLYINDTQDLIGISEATWGEFLIEEDKEILSNYFSEEVIKEVENKIKEFRGDYFDYTYIELYRKYINKTDNYSDLDNYKIFVEEY